MAVSLPNATDKRGGPSDRCHARDTEGFEHAQVSVVIRLGFGRELIREVGLRRPVGCRLGDAERRAGLYRWGTVK